MNKSEREGWSDMRPGDRVYHYMVEGSSLCGKVGFHSMHPDTLTAHNGDTIAGQKDCKLCFRKLMARLVEKPLSVLPERPA